MNLPRFAVERPVFISMITVLIIILGVVGLSHLPVDLLPEVERSSLSVNTSYTDASPQEVEESVTRPLEQSLGAVSGVSEVRSTSSEGQSSISIDFVWGTDLDAASNDVRDRIDRVLGQLPDDVSRPQVRQFDSAAIPVMMLAFASEMDPLVSREYVENNLVYRFERLPGVAAVSVNGGMERQIQVELDMDRILALQISFNDLLDRITRGNVNTPGGNIAEGNREIRVRVPGTYSSLDELRDTVILLRDGVPVRVRDVAQVTDGAADRRSLSRVDGQEAVRLMVYKQSGGNTVEVADAVAAEIERINNELPQGKLFVLFDTAEYIRQSIGSVTTAAVWGGMLAILVLLFFLRQVRSTLVVAMTIPVSVIGCFTLIYFAGYSINVMTLGGLALGIGMLVDSAIVVLENIVQKRDAGMNRREASITGAAEVGMAILASTLTTAVVFLPLLFIAGMAGLLFKQLAMVVTFSLFTSLVASLTLVPMLASRWLEKRANGNKEKFLARRIRILLESLESGYAALLADALQYRVRALVIIALILLSSLALVPYLGTELMPATDESEVGVNFEMESGTRIELVEAKVVELEKLIRDAVPEIRVLQASAGSSGWRSNTTNKGSFRVKLVPKTERVRSTDQVAFDLNKVLSRVAGIKSRCRVRSSMMGRIVGGHGNNTVDLDIRGHDLETGRQLAEEISRRAEELEGVTDAEVSRDEGVPERNIRVDRRKAADLDLSVKDVADALRTVLAGRRAGLYRTEGREYDILVRVKGADKMAIKDILDLSISNRKGKSVVLRNVLTEDLGTGPSAIERKDRERIVTVSVNAPGRDQGTVVSDLQKALADLPIPRGFAIVYSGGYEEQRKSFRELFFSLILALILVYIVMACQFESIRDPFIVMFAVPLAATGVILMLFLTNTTVNMQSFIGCIMLAGIVVNNAILLVDQTGLLRKTEGLGIRDALKEAGRRRLRPILMTAATTCLGLMPLALGLGDGGEAQAPMARAVIGGLLSSTLITLIVVPVVYTFITSRETGKQEA